MYRKFAKQNKIFYLIIVLLTILFVFLVFYTSNQIYKRDRKLLEESADSLLIDNKNNVELFFSEVKNDLLFLRDLPSMKNYIDSNFKSTTYKNVVKNLFYSFAKSYKKYYQIRIINSEGYEIIRIDNKKDGNTIIIADQDLQNKSGRYYFIDTIKLNKDEIYVSPIDLNIEHGKIEVPYVPVVRLATPLFNSENKKIGILVLNMYFEEVLKLLPEDMFIQTEEGNLISFDSDKSINFKTSAYNFEDLAGMLYISEYETIHYLTIEFLPGETFIIGKYVSYYPLFIQFQRLTLLSSIFFVLFICLILSILYYNFTRFKKLIDAHKAIIFGLAELAEYRDKGTGQHLERTRRYSVILANELRKNKKYRKIITKEYIEDLFDVAPLHDIGKVGIRDSILLKESRLTDKEYKEMKKHVQIGNDLMQHIISRYKLAQSFLTMGRNIIRYHHEKYNGKGYLTGLKGEKIPLEARIFALVDAYDAIRSKRPYKDALPHKEAIKRIDKDRGEHFDPDIVDAFLRCNKELLKISVTHKPQEITPQLSI